MIKLKKGLFCVKIVILRDINLPKSASKDFCSNVTTPTISRGFYRHLRPLGALLFKKKLKPLTGVEFPFQLQKNKNKHMAHSTDASAYKCELRKHKFFRQFGGIYFSIWFLL